MDDIDTTMQFKFNQLLYPQQKMTPSLWNYSPTSQALQKGTYPCTTLLAIFRSHHHGQYMHQQWMIYLQLGSQWTGPSLPVHISFPTAVQPINISLEDMALPPTIVLLPWYLEQIKCTTWQMVSQPNHASLELCD